MFIFADIWYQAPTLLINSLEMPDTIRYRHVSDSLKKNNFKTNACRARYLHCCNKKYCYNQESSYLERSSTLDFKDAATPRFDHSNVVFDLFMETRFSHLIASLSKRTACQSSVNAYLINRICGIFYMESKEILDQ